MKKTIVVSGGAEGLGKAIAKLFSKKHNVIILGRDAAKLQKTARELRCKFFLCDVSSSAQVNKTALEILKQYKHIDVLVNNAGQWIEGKLERNNPKDIQAAVASNTLGTIYLTHAFVGQLKKQKNGTIVNIVSIAGLRPKPDRAVYNASKYAITGFTKSLELELAPFNVRVVGIYPGKIKTNLFKNANVKKSMEGALEPEEIAKAIEFVINAKQSTLISHIEMRNVLYS